MPCACGGGAPEAHLDLRGKHPPEPMVAILSTCAAAAPGTSIVARLDRDPVFLYPELAEHGWTATRIDGEPGEVRLRITRIAP
jgi:hypothetical protein